MDSIDENKIIKEYLELKTQYHFLVDEVSFMLQLRLREENINYASITKRVKELDSFLEKIRRKNYEYPFSQNTDFAGVRLVYIYKDELAKIERIIKAELEIVEKVIQENELEVNQFGYGAVHYIVKLSKKLIGPRYESIKDLKCEIQVRTILQDSWALVSHHLQYKNENSVPKELLRKLSALSGNFYLIDDQLVEFRNKRFDYKSELKTNKDKLLEQPINYDSIIEYMKFKFPELDLVISHGFLESFPQFLNQYGYFIINDIESLLTRTSEKRKLFNEREDFGRSAAREIFVAVGFDRPESRVEFAIDRDVMLLSNIELEVSHFDK